jgi:AraC-like DNA-binding protein
VAEPIPLARARYAIGIITALREHGVPIRPLLEKVALHEELLQQPEATVTAFQLWDLAALAAFDTGIRDLGLAAGDKPWAAYGEFGSRIYFAPNLLAAMRAFCINAVAEYSRADFYIERHNKLTWFCRGPIDGTPEQREQIELIIVQMMVNTIRLAAGPDWQPSELHLQITDPVCIRDNPLFRNTHATFGSPTTRMGVGHMQCTVALNSSQPGEMLWKSNMERLPSIEAGLSQSLRLLLQPHAGAHMPDIEAVAGISNLSVRTLQRQLQDEGQSFATITNDVRFEAASNLLHNSNMSVSEICAELSYSDPAHFTRAFRRWSGMSPTQYRAAAHH